MPSRHMSLTHLGVADILRRSVFSVSWEGRIYPGLAVYGGEFWRWKNGAWQIVSRDAVEQDVAQALANIASGYRSAADRAWLLSSSTVREVAWALERLCRVDRFGDCVPDDAPVSDPASCIAFSDVVLDVRASAKAGVPVLHPRGPWWGGWSLTVPWQPLPCPTWDRCQNEWSDGDPVWIETRERAYGVALSGMREHGRALLEQGRSQSGKGSGTNDVLARVLPPGAFFSATVDQVVGDFGLDGIQHARVWVTTEVRDLEHGVGGRFATILKAVLGGDFITVNRKFCRQIPRVRVSCFPIIQSNTLPVLSDDAGSITSKLIVLPFRRSFAECRDDTLPRRLRAELPQIASRLAMAAIRFVADGGVFPCPEGARELLEAIRHSGNIADAFLEWGFVRDPAHAVPRATVLALLGEFQKSTGGRLTDSRGRLISGNQVLPFLERASSWPIKIVPGTSQEVMLRGVRVKIGAIPLRQAAAI